MSSNFVSHISGFFKRHYVLALLVMFIVVGTTIAQNVRGANEYSWHYKMTVTVETPEGIKIGSAVRKIIVKKAHPEIQGLNDTRVFVKGEAVIIDLGKRGMVFTLLNPDDSSRVFFDTFPGPAGLTLEGLKYYSNLQSAKATILPKKYSEFAPMVTFEDPANPKSVIGITGEYFSKYYGPNVKIKKIEIETTDEAMVPRIEKILPWLKELHGGYLDGKSSGGGPALSNILYGGNFKSGDE